MVTAEALVIPCAACGALNRVPSPRLGDVPVCATCHERLLDREPTDVTERILERAIARSDLPVVVDFWAPWCGPCRTMAPWYAEAAKRLKGRALTLKLDTERHPQIGAKFGVRSIPTLAVFHRGAELARQSGAVPADRIVAFVESAI